MHENLRVTWLVTPLQPPRVRRHCSRCAGESPFACSMKFRTNAQKKRLDVWLIYRCAACDEVWNLPLLERVEVGKIPPDAFEAMARNDPAVALRHAFERARLMRHGAIEDAADVAIRKAHDAGCRDTAGAIAIRIALVWPCGLRLDRLLALGLSLGRTRLGRLHETGALLMPRRALRSPPGDGQLVAIDLRPLDAMLAQTLRRRALA